MKSRIKYANGMYKTTSRIQNETSVKLFRSFSHQWKEYFTGMLQNFQQDTGDCEYTFTFADGKELMFQITRTGKILG